MHSPRFQFWLSTLLISAILSAGTQSFGGCLPAEGWKLTCCCASESTAGSEATGNCCSRKQKRPPGTGRPSRHACCGVRPSNSSATSLAEHGRESCRPASAAKQISRVGTSELGLANSDSPCRCHLQPVAPWTPSPLDPAHIKLAEKPQAIRMVSCQLPALSESQFSHPGGTVATAAWEPLLSQLCRWRN